MTNFESTFLQFLDLFTTMNFYISYDDENTNDFDVVNVNDNYIYNDSLFLF